MRKILFALLALFMVSCSKDSDTMVSIQNLSGKDWYDTQIWFLENEDNLEGYTEVGTVAIGKTCVVETDCSMFYVYAKDSNGKLIMSKPKYTGSSVTVRETDLY